MITHLEQELDQIKLRMFAMGDLAIEAIGGAVDALRRGDPTLAEKVLQGDAELDRLEVVLDEECGRILVTKQPAAGDLRLVLAVLKINTDLERMGDLASNIAQEALRLGGRGTVKPLIDIPRMASIAMEMIRDALRAFADRNAALARAVIERDREVDEINLQIYRELFTFMVETPAIVSSALGLILVAKALERIGDHATNIAEKAIYYIEGVDIRHQ